MRWLVIWFIAFVIANVMVWGGLWLMKRTKKEIPKEGGKQKRRLIEVRWVKELGQWVVFDGKTEISFHMKNVSAVSAGRYYADTHKPSELIVKTRAGRIRWKDSYGQDPEDTRG
jgi:hypothetical protein